MKNLNKDINSKSGRLSGSDSWKDTENDLLLNREDSALFERLGDYMKGRLDLDEVKKDPALNTTRDAVSEMISDYHKNMSENRDNEKFIRDVFSKTASEERINNDIDEIKQDRERSIVNEISSEWVKEWHQKKQMGNTDPQTEEIKEFISGSLKSGVSEPAKEAAATTRKGISRSLIIRYVSFSAAALIGVLIIIGTLLPSSDPEKIFNAYYKPFDAISPVTRSLNSDESGIYTSAIGYYRNGNYLYAASMFSESVLRDPSSVSSRFFLGLTNLALNNYDQAINLLSDIADRKGEYGKEAHWYLGLTYLKTGDKTKATQCFEYLANSNGFYKEGSEKILRRLK